jgi:hypothetical protein
MPKKPSSPSCLISCRRELLLAVALDHAGLQHVLGEIAGGIAHGLSVLR